MNRFPLLALALSGALVASAGGYAAEADNFNSLVHTAAAVIGPGLALSTGDEQREVIPPPASVDPGMALDPPMTGAKMPVIHPPGTAGGRLVLPH
ncbi:MAG: hypothetical protein JO032_09905 [Alphaproteobacteria bacterium]|nr:hypothetical protein [Alphaproteobacteria bacterium]MBV9553092.1 hypothetical protein [Alphaproteobacteria bacterium]